MYYQLLSENPKLKNSIIDRPRFLLISPGKESILKSDLFFILHPEISN